MEKLVIQNELKIYNYEGNFEKFIHTSYMSNQHTVYLHKVSYMCFKRFAVIIKYKMRDLSSIQLFL